MFRSRSAILQTALGNIRVSFVDDAERKRLLPVLRTVLQKSVACVGCQACEAECPTGALHASNGRVVIDETKCIHCLRCHSMDLGCWRYRSMRLQKRADQGLMESMLITISGFGRNLSPSILPNARRSTRRRSLTVPSRFRRRKRGSVKDC